MYLKILPFNKTLFGKDFKMIGWLCLIVAGMLFATSTIGVLSVPNKYEYTRQQYEENGWEFNSEEAIEGYSWEISFELEGDNDLQQFLIIIFPIVIASILFGEEKRRKTFEMLSSMPYTRYEIFFNKVLVGLVAIAIPYILNGIIMLAGFVISPSLKMFCSSNIIFTWMWNRFYSSLALLSFSTLIGVLTGTTIAQFVLTAIFLFFPIGIVELFRMNMVYWGFEKLVYPRSGGPGLWWNVSNFIENCSFINYAGGSYYFKKAIILISVSIAMLIISKILFDRNKVERSGETLEFEGIETFFKIGVTICFALLGPILPYNISENLISSRGVKVILGYILGAAIGWILSNVSIKLNRAKV